MESNRNLKLKICGMRDVENIRRVASLMPDYLGFIFYQKSPRYVGEDFAIPEELPRSIGRVGVFVNESTEQILTHVERHGLDFIQLHGHESVEQCRELRKHNVKIIKVFSVSDEMNFAVAKPYEEVADFFLFDTKGKYYGGNAQVFDWDILRQYEQRIPFFLSGGLSPENIKAAKELTDMNLHALDVNSGVEIQPALKDIDKIENIKTILNSDRLTK